MHSISSNKRLFLNNAADFRKYFQVSMLVGTVILLRIFEANRFPPYYPQALFSLAEDAKAKENVRLEDGYYRTILRIDPKNPKAYYGLGTIYQRKGDTLKAKYYLREALRVDNKFHEASRDLGFLYERAGQYALAAHFFKNALKGAPRHEYAYHAGRMFVLMGEKKFALSEVGDLKEFGEKEMAEALRNFIQTHLP